MVPRKAANEFIDAMNTVIAMGTFVAIPYMTILYMQCAIGQQHIASPCSWHSVECKYVAMSLHNRMDPSECPRELKEVTLIQLCIEMSAERSCEQRCEY